MALPTLDELNGTTEQLPSLDELNGVTAPKVKKKESTSVSPAFAELLSSASVPVSEPSKKSGAKDNFTQPAVQDVLAPQVKEPIVAQSAISRKQVHDTRKGRDQSAEEVNKYRNEYASVNNSQVRYFDDISRQYEAEKDPVLKEKLREQLVKTSSESFKEDEITVDTAPYVEDEITGKRIPQEKREMKVTLPKKEGVKTVGDAAKVFYEGATKASEAYNKYEEDKKAHEIALKQHANNIDLHTPDGFVDAIQQSSRIQGEYERIGELSHSGNVSGTISAMNNWLDDMETVGSTKESEGWTKGGEWLYGTYSSLLKPLGIAAGAAAATTQVTANPALGALAADAYITYDVADKTYNSALLQKYAELKNDKSLTDEQRYEQAKAHAVEMGAISGTAMAGSIGAANILRGLSTIGKVSELSARHGVENAAIEGLSKEAKFLTTIRQSKELSSALVPNTYKAVIGSALKTEVPAFAGGEAARQVASGEDISLEGIGHMGMFPVIMNTLIHGIGRKFVGATNTWKNLSPEAKNDVVLTAASRPIEAEYFLKKGVEKGIINKGESDAILGSITEAHKVISKLPKDIDPSTLKRVYPYMELKGNLESQLKSVDGAAKPHIEAQIEAVNMKVAEELGSPLSLKEHGNLEKLQEKAKGEDGLTKSEQIEKEHYETRQKNYKMIKSEGLSSAESRKLNILENKEISNEKLDKQEKSDLEYLRERRNKSAEPTAENVADGVNEEVFHAGKDVKVKNAPQGNHLNIGMLVGRTNELLTEEYILSKLPPDVKVEKSGVVEGTEPTLSIKTSRKLTNAEVAKLMDDTQQQAIPQLSDGVGVLHDAKKGTDEAWGDFNTELFVETDGGKLSEHKPSLDVRIEKAEGVEKKILTDAKNVLGAIKSIAPDAEVVIHDNNESFVKAANEKGADLKEGETGHGMFVDDANGTIHINMEMAKDNTALHEGAHPVLDYITANKPELVDELFTQLQGLEGGKESTEYGKQYEGVQAKKEAIVEWFSKVANGDYEINETNFEKAKNFVSSVLKTLGLENLASKIGTDRTQLIELAKQISEAFRTGEALKLEGEKKAATELVDLHKTLADLSDKYNGKVIPMDAAGEIKRAERKYVEKVSRAAEKFAGKSKNKKELLNANDLEEFAKSIKQDVSIGVIEGYNEGVTGIRIPNKNEVWLPMGETEEGLSKLFAKNPSPSSKELTKATNGIIRVADYSLIKEMAHRASEEFAAQKDWYVHAADLAKDLVGENNMSEFGAIWGVTSAQSTVATNLQKTLWAMMNARKFDLGTEQGAKQFAEAFKSKMPNGDKPLITGMQIDKIIEFYRGAGYTSETNVKTYVYSKLTADRGQGTFNPFTVMDTHMMRFFGAKDMKSSTTTNEQVAKGLLNPKIQRVGMYLTSQVAKEMGLRSDQAQSLAWFYAKHTFGGKIEKQHSGLNLFDTKALDEIKVESQAGGIEDAYTHGKTQPLIELLNDQVSRGEFDKSVAINDKVNDSPFGYISKQQKDIYSTYLFTDELAKVAGGKYEDGTPSISKTKKLDIPKERINDVVAGKADLSEQSKAFNAPQLQKTNLAKDTYYEPHLTESKDKKDYVFFHVSGGDKKSIEKGIDSRKFNSTRTNRQEKGLQYGVASYYTKPTDGERMVGGDKYAVHVPKDKVYTMDTDPNGYRKVAEAKIPAKTPFREEKIRQSVAEQARKDGFEMAVGEWGYDRKGGETETPALRADALVPLKPQKEASGLEGEAKKYDSADEFVKAQTVVYHGSSTKLNKFNNKQGTFFTDDMQNADGYAGGENVYEGYLDFKNPLVIDAKGRMYNDLKSEYGKSTTEIAGSVDANKYDGIIFKNIKDSWIDDADYQDPSTIYYAFKPRDSFKNESQLIDIWDKRNEGYKPATTKQIPHPEKEALIAKKKITDLANEMYLEKPNELSEEIRQYGGIRTGEGDAVRQPTIEEFKEMTKGLKGDLAKQAKEAEKSLSKPQLHKTTDISQSTVERNRELYGVGMPTEKQVKHRAELEAQADRKIKEGYDIEGLIKEVVFDAHTPSDVEMTILGKFQAAKEGELDKANSEYEKAVKENKPTDELAEKRNKIIDDLYSIYKAAELGTSSAGSALRAIQNQRKKDYTLANMYDRKMKANDGKKLSQEQIDEVAKQYKAISEANEKYKNKIADLEAKLQERKAQHALDLVVREQRAQGRRATREVIFKEREVILKDLKDAFKPKGDVKMSLSPIPDEALAPIARLVKNYAEEGVTRVQDLVDIIHGHIKDAGYEASDRDIRDAILGVGKPLERKTKTELQQQVADLKTQAKLINKLEDLERGIAANPTKNKPKYSEEVKELKAKIKDFQDAEREENRPTQQEISLKAYKTRVVNRINELSDKLSRGDFEKKERPKLELDEEAIKLKDEYRKARYEYELALQRDELNKRSGWEKTKSGVYEVLNVGRAVMTSFDFSAPLRQGLVATASHPKIALKAAAEMFKQSLSQNRFDRWFDDLENSHEFTLMKESGLYIADPHNISLTAKEEQFMTNLAAKVPVVGWLIKGSERAYVSYLNKMRADLFQNGVETFKADGLTPEKSKEVYKAWADFVNNATGRGNLGKLENSAEALNTLFFSPRLMASRINLLNPAHYVDMPAAVRKRAAGDMAKTLSLGMSVIALAVANGWDVEEDPRSTDFGKIKVGNTRWDVWGGFQGYVRVLAQLLSGEKKSLGSGKIQQLDGATFPFESRADVGARFLRGKLAPIPSLAYDLAEGENIVGEKVELEPAVLKRFLPMIYQDLSEAIQEHGNKAIFTVGIPSIFGVSANTFEPHKSKERPTRPERPERPTR